jgi:hypothetical protein
MRRLGSARGAALLAAMAAVLAPDAARAADPPTRYSLAGGCYAVTDAAGKRVAEKARLKASALGRYLLYLPDATFLGAGDDGSLAPAGKPGPATDFAVEEAAGGTFTLTPASTGKPVATVRFDAADGCAEFPEAPLNAEGDAAKAPTEYGEVSGIVEGHMHWMAFQNFGGNFNCGAPWHPYGITRALPDCSEVEGPQGAAAPIQNTFTYGNPAQPHDTRGYPQLTEWSKDHLTYTGTYHRWVERVWKAGLRLMVMGVNENRVLCELQANRKYDCNEMNSMRRGFKAIRELQDYVDAQAGGPGKGFFQIVTDPFEARRVISQGRMAVVLEIETSEPFDCINWEKPTCDKAQIDRQLDEMYRLGVRSSLLLNKFDNPLTGVRFDSGAASYLINAGNKVSAGTFWSVRTCGKGELQDNEISQPNQQAASFLDTTFSGLGVPSGTLPAYPPPPHCNRRGLTELGRHVVKRMMDLGMIVNPDHMSQAAVDDTLTLLESRRYSGVISPHGWVDPGNWPRLWKLGGMAFPGHSDADKYVKEWEQFRPQKTPFRFGWGYGADLGGLSHQPGPSEKGSITYPFKSYDGKVTFDRQKTGERTFDYAKEGVSHYGLYADWFEDLRRVGGNQMAQDMSGGAEAYLQMWERAVGIESKRCFFHQDGVTPEGRGPLRLGEDWKTVLRRAGQPQQRGRAWSWCVKGRGNGAAADVAVLDRGGKVTMVGTTARGRRARRVYVGASVRELRRAGARPVRGARSLRVKRAAGRVFVYAVRGGRVRAIAVTTRESGAQPRALRTAMRRVLSAKASAAPREFVPAKAQASGKMLGRTLTGTGDRQVDAKLALLCGLEL